MKQILFILVALITTNVGYASFPIKEKIQDEYVQTNDKNKIEQERADKSARISLILTSIAALFVLLFANSDLTTIGLALITFLILAVASIFAIFGLFSKTNWWKGLFALIATSILLPLLFS